MVSQANRRQPQHPKARAANPLGPEHKRNPIKQSAVPSAKLAKCTRTQLNIFKLTNHAHTPLLSSPGVTQAIIIPSDQSSPSGGSAVANPHMLS